MGKKAVALDYPRPYWQVFDDFRARESYSSYLGEVPLVSTVPVKELAYTFVFKVRDVPRACPQLVLDPRCARGAFRILLNGQAVGGRRLFPLPHIHPLRVPLRGLKEGRNRIEIRFAIESAMEGLLSQLFVEGDFEVVLRGESAILTHTLNRVGWAGWTTMGLPHYMGAGCYAWEEDFGATDLVSDWKLELHRIIDSSRLSVNGIVQGVCAWSPWEWALTGLRPGRNRFELRVSSTAGNKFELDWPNQPQGWIGGGKLIALVRGKASGPTPSQV